MRDSASPDAYRSRSSLVPARLREWINKPHQRGGMNRAAVRVVRFVVGGS